MSVYNASANRTAFPLFPFKIFELFSFLFPKFPLFFKSENTKENKNHTHARENESNC